MGEWASITNAGAEIRYQRRGSGAPVVLLHPYPTHHGFWEHLAGVLENRYTVLLPDLRGHGGSGAGEGAATMARHAEDIGMICEHAGAGRAAFIGCSIGGYILFEFIRQHRERATGIVLCNTKAAPDSDEVRANRYAAITQIETQGPADYLDGLAQKLVGATTQRNRPDILRHARSLMLDSTVAGLRAVLLGMAERPDSVPSLAAITAPALIIGGADDTTVTRQDLETMHRGIRGSRLEVVPATGHYTPIEDPDTVTRTIRSFLDAHIR